MVIVFVGIGVGNKCVEVNFIWEDFKWIVGMINYLFVSFVFIVN